MTLKIFTDGGSKGNPGPSAIGIVFYVNDKKIYDYREDIGITTNNVAEYTAVIRALSKIKEDKTQFGTIDSIQFVSDSALLVNQLNGIFKIKKAHINELVLTIKSLVTEIAIPVSYTLVRREQNTVADALVNNKSVA